MKKCPCPPYGKWVGRCRIRRSFKRGEIVIVKPCSFIPPYLMRVVTEWKSPWRIRERKQRHQVWLMNLGSRIGGSMDYDRIIKIKPGGLRAAIRKYGVK